MPTNQIPGVKVELIDGQLRPVTLPVQPKVTLLGVTNSPNVTVGEPTRVESDNDAALFDDFFLADGTTPSPTGPVQKPSELTRAIAETFAGGADNVEVVVLPDPTATNLALELTPTNQRRYDSLDSFYTLLKFTPVDIVVPVGTTIDATGLAATDNYGYQLANFCHQTTINERSCHGVIGVTPPVAGDTTTPTLAQLETWVTALEAFDTSSILGTDFTIGDGVDDTDADNVPDTYAFWATSDEAIPVGSPPRYDADVDTDRRGEGVDIGKYLSVVADQGRFVNEVSGRVNVTGGFYHSNLAPAYAGLISNLPARVGTTNQIMRGATAVRALAPSQAERLLLKRYITFLNRPTGYVVANGVTWAHKISNAVRSDYTQLTTLRITFDAVSFVRTRAIRYIGQPNNAQTRAALRTDVDEALGVMQKIGALQRYDFQLNITPAQAVLGTMTVDLKLVPAFEILEITVTAALSAE
jgi:hypothetical protein